MAGESRGLHLPKERVTRSTRSPPSSQLEAAGPQGLVPSFTVSSRRLGTYPSWTSSLAPGWIAFPKSRRLLATKSLSDAWTVFTK